MKINKKIVVLSIASIMIFSGFIVLISGNSNNVKNSTVLPFLIPSQTYNMPNDFTQYGLNYNSNNYTLPNYNFSFLTSYEPVGSKSNPAIFSSHNEYGTGFFYLNNSKDFVFYNINTEKVTYIHNITLYYTIGGNSINVPFTFYQKTNGELVDLAYVGTTASESGNIIIQNYNFLNNTFTYYNTGISWITYSSYAILDHYGWFWIANDWDSSSTDNYFVNIYTKQNIEVTNGLNYGSDHNGADAIFGTNSIIHNDQTGNASQNAILHFNTTTLTDTYINLNVSLSNYSSDYNNMPFYEMPLANGSVEVWGPTDIASTNYNDYANMIFDISNNSALDKLVNVNYYTNIHATDQNFNQIVLTNNGKNEGEQAFPDDYTSLQINYLNRTGYYANNKPLDYIYSTRGTNSTYTGTVYQNYSINAQYYASYNNNYVVGVNLTNGIINVLSLPSSNIINKYTVEIKENGLPSGTSWSYVFNGTSETLTNNSYNYLEPNGNYSLSVSSINGYTVSYPSVVKVDGSNVIAYVNFTAIPKYTVTIKENGLPTDTQWNFSIKQSGNLIIAKTLANTSYNVALANGSYDLYAGTVSGYNLHIHTSPFTVSGSAITEYVNYTAIPTYTLFLKETGLASGTTWIAYVGSTQYSSSNAYINVTGLVNGTYSLSIDNVADYSLGSYPTSFTISGSNYYINVTFTHNTTLHSVKIIAEHIANVNSITWSVVFNGTTYSSQNSNTIIIPSLKNGTYSFSVNAISGYVIDKYPSSLTIDGANITQYIYFNETFSISIVVSGYLGQYTYVFNGTAHSISGNTVINGLVNYTYSFSVNAISGYTITYNSPIIISGKDVTENVTFTAVVTKTGEYIVEFIITGLAPHTTWSVTVNGQEYVSNTYELNITLANGTYYPDITAPNNYVLNDEPALVVAGNNTVYYISASPTTFGSFIQYIHQFL